MLDAANQLPQADSSDRRHFLFYQDEGGLRASDEQNQDMDIIYYVGVIDICTPYSTAKKLEHFWKSMTEDRVSCQHLGRGKTDKADEDLVCRSCHVWSSIPQFLGISHEGW
jgi:hypothetical protein